MKSFNSSPRGSRVQALLAWIGICALGLALNGCAHITPPVRDQQLTLAVFGATDSDPGAPGACGQADVQRLATPMSSHSPVTLHYTLVKADTVASTLPSHLSIYGVDSRVLASTVTTMGPCAEVAITYQAIGPLALAPSIEGTSPPTLIEGRTVLGKFSLMVLSNAVPGQEAAYDTWYDNQHVPDVLRIPGFLSGQRYVLHEVERGAVRVPRYMVMFDFESYDLESTIADLKLRNRSGVTKMSTAIDGKEMHVYFYSRR